MKKNIPSGIANQQQQVEQQIEQIEEQQKQLQIQIEQLQAQQPQQVHQSQTPGSTGPTSSNVSITHISTADEIFNGLNFLKFSKLIKEPCNSVMMIIFQCFYNWGDASPQHLADHLQEIPLYQTKKLNKIFIKDEIAKIKDMKIDITKMTKYDIPFFYKLIQFGTNSNKIAAPNDKIWSTDCSPPLDVPLEHLLFLVKKDRNTFCHIDTKVINILNLTNEQIEDYCDSFLQRLQSIIKQVGARTGVDQALTDERCYFIERKITCIKNLKHISTVDKTDVIQSLRERDLLPQLKNLERAFNNELKSYCPPNFLVKSDESEIKTSDLLLLNDQVTIISGEAGHGKTTLTKYIPCQKSKLESGNSAAIENLCTFTFVFRVVCRDIRSKDVAQFIEGQLPNAKILFPTTSSLREHLNDESILWVIDGRDEATADFHGFFQSLLKNFPEKHKIIITTRPNCVEDLENEIGGSIKTSTMSIKCFVDEQIKEVAEKYLEDVTKYNNFMSFYQNSLNDTKELLKKPINLSLSLQLWKLDSKLLKGKLTSYKLFEIIFEELHNRLVDRLIGRTNILTKDGLKFSVNKWFDILSKIAFKKHFYLSYSMSISKMNEKDLNESALEWKLMEDDCLSSIFDSEITSTGTNYSFKHNIQIEVLASFYLKGCDRDMLKEIAEDEYVSDYLNKRNSIDPFDFLFECCDSLQYSRIFSVFLKFHPTLQYAGYFLKIQSKNVDYFNDLIKEIGVADQPLTVILYDQNDTKALKSVIESASPNIRNIDLIVEIRNDYGTINTVLNEYKNRGVSFRLSLKIENKLEPVIKMFRNEENEQMVNKLILLGSDYEKSVIEEISCLENVTEVLFEINASILSMYSKSVLAYLASSHDQVYDNNHSILNLPIVSETKYSPPSSSSSKSMKLFRETCHVHFRISCGIRFNVPIVIQDLLKVNEMFRSLSVDLDLWIVQIHYLTNDQKDSINEFLSSTVRVKELKIHLKMFTPKGSFLFQLIKCNIQRLEIIINDESCNYNSEVTFDRAHLLPLEKICEFKLTNLKEIYFQIVTPDQLEIIYKKLRSRVIDKTIIKVLYGSDKSEMEWIDTKILQISDKKLRKLEILSGLNSEVNESLESISKYFQIQDRKMFTRDDHNTENDTLHDQKIKKIVLSFLGKTEGEAFLSVISLNEHLKMFMKKARRNVVICLQSWEVNPCLFNENSLPDNLYESLFEKQKNLILERQESETNIEDKNELVQKADRWIYSDFCRIAADIVLNREFRDFSKSNELELLKLASEYGLIGTECLSIFMKSENTPTGINYSFREYQKEASACLYLKNSDDDQVRRVAERYGLIIPIEIIINFLSEFCNDCQFARILAIFLSSRKEYEFRAVYLKQIKTKDESYFDALIKEINHPLMLYLDDVDDVKAFVEIIPSLSLQLHRIDLVAISCVDWKMVNNILTKYKDLIKFRLILKLYDEQACINAIQMFKDQQNQDLISTLILFPASQYQKTAMIEISSLKNLLLVYISNSLKYSKSYLADFACSNFIPITDSTALLPSLHLILNIDFDKTKPREVMKDLLKVNNIVRCLSVTLEFIFINPDDPESDLDEILVSQFLVSSVQIKDLSFRLKDLSTDSIWFKFINSVGIETLKLELRYSKNNKNGETMFMPTPLSILERILEIWEFKQPNMRDLEFQIMTPDQLIILYKKLPSEMIEKSTVLIYHDWCRPENEWKSSNIPKFSGRKFKTLQSYSGYSSPYSFKEIETIKRLRDISVTVDVK